MNAIVREATLADAELIADLTRQAWKDKVTFSSAGHRETPEEVIENLREGGGFILFVDDTPAGSVRWAPLYEDHDIWEIQRLGIIPDFCGHNFSQYLLEAVIHHAMLCEIDELRMTLHAGQDRLFDYYAAYGFEPAPELENPASDPMEPPPAILRRRLD